MKSSLVVLTALLLSGVSIAQPQAPIVWGEAHFAHIAGWPGLRQVMTWRVIPIGDTLLFTAGNEGTPVSDTILVCSSFDNGQTFTPWIRITQGDQWVFCQFAASAGRYYCFLNGDSDFVESCWLQVSDDGGLTWGPRLAYRQHAGMLVGFPSGAEVIAKFVGLVNNVWSQCVIRSTNGGQSWSTPIVIDTVNFHTYYITQTIAFTRSHRLILEQPIESLDPDDRLYVARGDRTGQNWTTFQPLPSPNWGSGVIYGDTANGIAGVLQMSNLGSVYGQRAVLYRTTDGGTTWGDGVPLTDGNPWFPSWADHTPLLIAHGKLWMVGWEQDDPQGWNFLGTRFSANHGKNWYPLQIAADSVALSMSFNGQIRGKKIDLYWTQLCWDSQGWLDYRMVTGTIRPDNTSPLLLPVTSFPETVSVGEQVSCEVIATDNDTLSEVRLMVVGSSGDTLHYGMERGAENHYQFTWTVPDSGRYWGWFEAEDFWENIATLPDSGTFHFVTEGWSAASDFIPHPSSFSLSVSPNPFNSMTHLEFTLPSTERVSLRLHDVLGREVAVLMNEIETAGQHRLTFDASGLPSGVYLCRLEAGGMVQTRKMMLVK